MKVRFAFPSLFFASRSIVENRNARDEEWKTENGSRFGLAWEEKRGKARGERPRRVWGMPKCQSKYETPARGEKEREERQNG